MTSSDQPSEEVLHVVTCYDCSFETVWDDSDTAIDRRDFHAEENDHEVYYQKEEIKRDE